MSPAEILALDATAIAAAVRSGALRARQAVEASLEAIRARDSELNCFTHVFEAEALRDADAIDRILADGKEPGPLAGVPFAAKNLFDIAGLTTLAGSKILAANPPAVRDAAVVARLKAAGAILVGATNMDEFAYGFVTENAHYGTTRNPPRQLAGCRRLLRRFGGSGGGGDSSSRAWLGYQRLDPRSGSFLRRVRTQGHLWPHLARRRISLRGELRSCGSNLPAQTRDLALAFDLLHGPDTRDPVCSTRPPELVSPLLEKGLGGLRVAVLGGYFARGAEPGVFAAVEKAARALGAAETVELPEVELARAAAFLITAVEGGNLHLDRLRTRAADFDPAVVDRLMAGALIPASWYMHAQRFRRIFQERSAGYFSKPTFSLRRPRPALQSRPAEDDFL